MSPDDEHMMEMLSELCGASGNFGYCLSAGLLAMAAMYRKKCNALMEEMERYASKCERNAGEKDPPEGSGGLEPDGGDDRTECPAQEGAEADVPRETSAEKQAAAHVVRRVMEANRRYRGSRKRRARGRRR